MNIAIIGCGTMGMTHALNLAKLPGVTLTAVVDTNVQRAERAAARTGARWYTDVDALLEAEQLETVLVCVPTDLHKPFVLKLAERGLHVICEKPAALSSEDALEMKEACEKHGVRLFIGHVVRFFPNYQDAYAKANSGQIGIPRMAHLKRYGSYPKGMDAWYHDASRSGGVILDLMIHDIDFACWLFGAAESVYATLVERGEPAVEYAQVTIQFKNRAIANLTGYWGYPGSFTTQFEVSGDQGIVRFDSNQAQSLDIKLAAGAADEQASAVQVPSSPSLHDPYYYEVEHFIECIRSGGEPLVSIDDAAYAVTIARAAEQSAQTGQPVMMGGTVS
ncbi:Gfo/Idh/MocA family oxidoreductase [Paenibacillus sp. JCM 10914]|uniref:Gfo/Idh/MocA family protein n=1 Tax=Paenibacillus sp. JCM 10914 TaxID=1236974 RepID=UPI0003CC2730|nr:Gfo/Idh/MocA family oxidoreductase [Paenibacillus sp. JCM 10914]GAE07734.1 NADH-dependent dyhydrogenase [Paenibacillus sp. JCM 10914]